MSYERLRKIRIKILLIKIFFKIIIYTSSIFFEGEKKII